MEEETLNQKELSSELTGLNKGEKDRKRKQYIIDISLSVLAFIIFIVIIIVSTSNSRDDEKNREDMSEIGEISCIYEIKTNDRETMLLGNEFIKNSDLDIYIDDIKIKYTKEYKFSSTGNHKVKIALYNSINMDYMFKDVPDLISVEMKSEQNCEITSMISSFENCENLNSFKIMGFNGEKIKSMKKLFYRSSLTIYSFSSFNTINLEDISYMFSSSSIEQFSLIGLNTSNIINMSHILEDCTSLRSIDLSEIDTGKVKDLSFMFRSCNSLNSLDLSNFVNL